MTAPLLTDAELIILQRSAAGDTYDAIGADLHIHPRAVGKAASRMFPKLGARSMPHAVLLACRAGLLDGKPRRHGDHAGFAAHVYRGEDPWACTQGCPEGERAYRAERRAARRTAQQAPAATRETA